MTRSRNLAVKRAAQMMMAADAITVPFVLLPGGQLITLVGPVVSATAAVVYVGAALCRSCKEVYRGLKQSLHEKLCRDEFCHKCYDGLATGAGQKGVRFSGYEY